MVFHRDCGGEVTAQLTCAKCDVELTARDVETRLGPGARGVAARYLKTTGGLCPGMTV